MFSQKVGKCSYCKSENVALIEPIKLRDDFISIINIYRPDDNGKLLVEWLMEDWQLFTHKNIDVLAAKNLLADILDDGEIVRQRYLPSKNYQSENLVQWERLREELMYENRYFPNETFHKDRLKELLSYLIADDLPENWYRARMQSDGEQIPIEKMGAPPKDLATHGRANPAGIPYLYLASTKKTAASETRPHTGQISSIAQFLIPSDIKIVDLRNPRNSISPFILADEDEIGFMRSDIKFLEKLGEELTRPVQKNIAPIHYVPSQYLCEFIKNCGYEGVIYRSSVSEGINLALFDPKKAKPQDVSQHKIASVSVEVIPLHSDCSSN